MKIPLSFYIFFINLVHMNANVVYHRMVFDIHVLHNTCVVILVLDFTQVSESYNLNIVKTYIYRGYYS